MSGPDERKLAIGIDLGGSNLRGALFADLAKTAADAPPWSSETPAVHVQPIAEDSEPVGDRRTPDDIVERIAQLTARLAGDVGVAPDTIPVGVGFPGMLAGREGHVANSPHLRWRDVPFGERLRARLGPKCRVEIENDVNAIAWGESKLGVGRGASDLLQVFIGTGIGGGAILDGQLLRGSSGCAVEIGHTKVVFDDRGRQCACGMRGCVEAYAGGAFITQRARAEIKGGAFSMATRLAGGPDNLHPGHLDQAAAEGDSYALGLWAEIAPLVGAALANAVTLLNPERLILGGGVLSRTPVLRAHVVTAFEVAVNPPAADRLQVIDAALSDTDTPAGAALLALA